MKSNKKILFEIGLFLTFAIFISLLVLNKPLGDLDEIWNYNFANCITKGMVPYKDFSMVQTPLLPFITGGLLSVFPNTLLTMRVLAIILCSSIFFVIYKVCNKLKINQSIILLAICGLLVLYANYYCIDYNYFSVLLTLLIIYFELTLNMEKKSSNFLIGFIAGLTFLTKQSIGGFVCVSIVLYRIIIEIYESKSKNLRFNIKNILFRILGGILPIAVFLIYLLITDSLYGFMDYAIIGITTFSNKVSYMNLINSNDVFIKLLSIYIPISFIIMLIYSIKKKDKNVLIILTLSVSAFVLVFPISDNIHFLIGIIPAIIGNLYLIEKIIRKIYSKKLMYLKFFLEACSRLTLLIILIFGIYNIYLSKTDTKYYSNLKHFENIPISEDFENTIRHMDEYISTSDKKVYILNFDAAIYMIPLDIYNKNYDMLMKGNFGSEGEEGLIHDIETKDNSVFLVLNNKLSKNWQHPHKVTKFIEQNLRHIGSIDNYEIYTK